jgi:transcriptional regulator with XRE-family HTH domain
MNRALRIALAEKDLTVKELAKEIGRHPGYVSSVLCGFTVSAPAREAISRALRLPIDHLWPDDKSHK